MNLLKVSVSNRVGFQMALSVVTSNWQGLAFMALVIVYDC